MGRLNRVCELMYTILLKDLEAASLKVEGTVDNIERCFNLHYEYWHVVASFVKNEGFDDLQEEIRFFKYWKPLFVSGAMFQHMLYNAALFQPGDFVEDLRFWQRELNRVQDRLHEYRDFYKYYISEKTDRDNLYFRRNLPVISATPAMACLPDEGLTSSHDRLVSMLMAYKRYEAYVEQHTVIADVLAEGDLVLN